MTRKVPTTVDWDEFGRVAMGAWEIAPSEFRTMTPREFWLIYDAKVKQTGSLGGPPTHDEIVTFERGIVDRHRETHDKQKEM